MITEDILPALQGMLPSNFATCSKEGVPNSTYVSQAFFVDEDHLALSFQFFNKTIQNVRENKMAVLRVYHPANLLSWDISVEYHHSETEGDLFDQMDMQLEAIASMSGMADVFKLKAADVYRVISVQKNSEEKLM